LQSGFTIRRAGPDDAASICAVHRESVLGLCSGHYDRGELVLWAESATPKLVAEALEQNAVAAFVAETGGRVVGFSAAMSDLIRGVYVHPDFVRRGLGGALLMAAEENAAAEGVGVLRLYATLNSVEFYEKQGYRTVRRSDYPLTPNLSLDCLVMEKDLSLG
jgi:ribosomal protein S18 acetylase RimI-like enzyme